MGVCHLPGRLRRPMRHSSPVRHLGGRAVSQVLTCETPPAFAGIGHRDRDDHRPPLPDQPGRTATSRPNGQRGVRGGTLAMALCCRGRRACRSVVPAARGRRVVLRSSIRRGRTGRTVPRRLTGRPPVPGRYAGGKRARPACAQRGPVSRITDGRAFVLGGVRARLMVWLMRCSSAAGMSRPGLRPS